MDRQRPNPPADLFQPVLQEQTLGTATYDINKLLYVAFFGGVLPMAILGTRNAIWLNVKKSWIYTLGIVAGLMWLATMFMTFMYMNGAADREARYFSRGLAVLLYLAYRWVLARPFRQHMVLHGDVEPLWKDGLLAVIGIGIAELLLVLVLSAVVN